MSTALQALDQRQARRRRKSGVLAERILLNTARFMRALAAEISRIPSYQDEASRLREDLRRR